MDKTPPNKLHTSIDGFVPRTPQNRHVGFDHRLRSAGSLPGVRQRRPGFRKPSPPAAAANMTGRVDGFANFTPRRTAQISPRQVESPRPQLGNRPESHQQLAVESGRRHLARWRRVSCWRTVFKRTALGATLLIVLCGGWLSWKILRDTSKVFGGSSSLLGFLSATKLKGEDTGRVNILLAGNSADDPGHDGANLTDSIMLISIDVRNNTALMMSIPRDLDVQIPGNGYAKINEAYPDGQAEGFSQAGYPKGGMGLLEKVVSQTLGIPIEYYGLIDYGAFRDAVNAVGGVHIDVRSTDPRGLYDPNTQLHLKNGWQTLNGKVALRLARSRGDGYGSYGFPGSDFDRTQNQRELLLALKDKALSSGVLANPLKLGQVFDAIGNNVHTDLSVGNVHRLYDISKHLSSANIKSYGLDNVTFSGQQNTDLLANYTTPNGESALIPAAGLGNYGQLRLLWQQLTSDNPVVKEAANVVVLNAGNITGLAGTEGRLLAGKGMDVSTTDNAPEPQTANSIIDNSHGKDPATLAELKQLFGGTITTNATLTARYSAAAFVIILGASQPAP